MIQTYYRKLDVLKLWFVLIWIMIVNPFSLEAQTRPNGVLRNVADIKNELRNVKLYKLFTEDKNVNRSNKIAKEVKDAKLLKIDTRTLSEIRQKNEQAMQLQIPWGGRSNKTLVLKKSKSISDQLIIRTASNPNQNYSYEQGQYYYGMVADDEESVVSLSIFKNEIRAIISNKDGNFVLGKLEDDNTTYVLYNDRNLKNRNEFLCSTSDIGIVYSSSETRMNRSMLAGDCTKIYVEVDETITFDKGGVSQAADYVTGLFNEVATLYANDGITIGLSELFIWDVPSPYTGPTAEQFLSQFQANTTSINGDLGVLLSYGGGGGVAATIDGLCKVPPSNLCYAGIQSTYENVPIYSTSVLIFTHELGHLFGSVHTHACSWNGNGTQIDGCWVMEGFCPPRNELPTNGGTIMSYCNKNPGSYTDFTLGFGPQPTAVIQNNVNNSTCLDICPDTSCQSIDTVIISSITDSTAMLSWTEVDPDFEYTIKYKLRATETWASIVVDTNIFQLTNLVSGQLYDYNVFTKCDPESFSEKIVGEFLTAGNPTFYCSNNYGTFNVLGFIENTQLSNINNTKSFTGGYADFTNVVGYLVPGNTYVLKIKLSNGAFFQRFRAWIDYNRDFDFNDTGELLADFPPGSTSEMSLTFTVPIGVNIDSTQLIIISRVNGWPEGSCTQTYYSDTEDYTIKFIANPPSTCDIPSDLTMLNPTFESIELSWSPLPNADSYIVEYREVGIPTWTRLPYNPDTSHVLLSGLTDGTSYEWRVKSNCFGINSDFSDPSTFSTYLAPCLSPQGGIATNIGINSATLTWNTWNTASEYEIKWKAIGDTIINLDTVTTNSILLNNLSAATGYEWSVRSLCGTNFSANSALLSFITSDFPPISYCYSEALYSYFIYIAHVQVSDLDHLSGRDNGYEDFTSFSATLLPDSTYTMNLVSGTTGHSFSTYWNVWIDYNGNGSYEDPGELIGQAQGHSVGAPAVSFTFTVPDSIEIYSTQMRVSLKNGAFPGSCELAYTWPHGESEQYKVLFDTIPPPECMTPQNLSSTEINANTFKLQFDNVPYVENYVIQRKISDEDIWDWQTITSDTSIMVTNLLAGKSYVWRVKALCGLTKSNFSSLDTFNTDLCNAVVSSLNDSGLNTLREALYCASEGDTITFDPSLSNAEIVLASPLAIVKSLTIDGSMAPGLTINGQNLMTPIAIPYFNTVTLKDLQIKVGNSEIGGALYNLGYLNLEDVIFDRGAGQTGTVLNNMKSTLVKGNVLFR